MEMGEDIHFNNILCIFVEFMYNPKLCAAWQLFLDSYGVVYASGPTGDVNKNHGKRCTQLPLA